MWSASRTSGGRWVSSTAATLVPMAWIAKTRRQPSTWVKYARSAATSRLGVYTKSSCWNGGVVGLAMGSTACRGAVGISPGILTDTATATQDAAGSRADRPAQTSLTEAAGRAEHADGSIPAAPSWEG